MSNSATQLRPGHNYRCVLWLIILTHQEMESCASKIVYLDVFFPMHFNAFPLLKGSPEKRTTSGFPSIDSANPICVMEIANGCHRRSKSKKKNSYVVIIFNSTVSLQIPFEGIFPYFPTSSDDFPALNRHFSGIFHAFHVFWTWRYSATSFSKSRNCCVSTFVVAPCGGPRCLWQLSMQLSWVKYLGELQVLWMFMLVIWCMYIYIYLCGRDMVYIYI